MTDNTARVSDVSLNSTPGCPLKPHFRVRPGPANHIPVNIGIKPSNRWGVGGNRRKATMAARQLDRRETKRHRRSTVLKIPTKEGGCTTDYDTPPSPLSRLLHPCLVQLESSLLNRLAHGSNDNIGIDWKRKGMEAPVRKSTSTYSSHRANATNTWW